MSTEMITQLPTVTNAAMSDITVAVQGYNPPTSQGLTVQESLQQIFNLFLANNILNFAGNPNGNVAGNTFQLCWDTTDSLMYVCTFSGSTSTAIWNLVGLNGSLGLKWNDVTGTSQSMSPNNGYTANNSSLVTLTLPTTAAYGTALAVCGKGSGGWTIAQNSGQQINFGNISTTLGASGSLSSSNRYDSVSLLCTVANTTWTVNPAPQGILTVV